MSDNLRAIFISVVLLELLVLAKAKPASAAPTDNIYSVCDIRNKDAPDSGASVNIVGKTITIRAELGMSYHFGVILTDSHCVGNFVRIILPVPDPKNVSQNFGPLYTQNQTTAVDGEYFMCDCSGRISFKYDIPELYIDDSVIEKLHAPEKLPRK